MKQGKRRFFNIYFLDTFLSSKLKVSITQGSLQRSEVAITLASFLWCQNVKLLPIIAPSQGGADNYGRQGSTRPGALESGGRQGGPLSSELLGTLEN